MSGGADLAEGFHRLLTESVDDPRPFYAELRERAPSFRTPFGFWYITRYDLANAVIRDPNQWVVDPHLADRDHPAKAASYALRVWHGSIQYADGGVHKRLRRLVNGLFTPSAAAAIRSRIEASVDALLDSLDGAGGGEVDFRHRFADVLPNRVILGILGLDTGRIGEFIGLSNSIAAVLEPAATDDAVRNADAIWRSAADYLLDEAERRRAAPREDLLTALVEASDDDSDRLSGDELVSLVLALAVAGHETTANMLCNSIYHLLRNPAALAELRGDPSLMPSAVEELVRYEPPPRNAVGRFAVRDTYLGDQLITAGEQVYVGNQAANHDPAAFTNPLELNLRRAPNRHLGFGTGVHHCLGASLARIELDVSLRKILARYPDLALTSARYRWRTGFVIRGLERLPVALGAPEFRSSCESRATSPRGE